jgi:hypothetical protein
MKYSQVLYIIGIYKMVPLRPVPQKRVRYAVSTDTRIPPDSRFGLILNKPRSSKPVQIYSGVISSSTYKEDLRRGDRLLGIDPLVTESVLAKLEIIPYVITKAIKESVVPIDIITMVVSDLKVKGKKISINFTCPIENLYVKYYSKGKKPPLNERVLAYSKIGYSDQKLAKMIKFEDDQKKNSDEIDKFLTTIFGDQSKKKTTANPKKKTLLQMIGYKKPKYAVNEDSAEDV